MENTLINSSSNRECDDDLILCGVPHFSSLELDETTCILQRGHSGSHTDGDTFWAKEFAEYQDSPFDYKITYFLWKVHNEDDWEIIGKINDEDAYVMFGCSEIYTKYELGGIFGEPVKLEQ